MTGVGRQTIRIAALMLAFGCGGPVVPAAPDGLPGSGQPTADEGPATGTAGTGGTVDPSPQPPPTPTSDNQTQDLGYKADCETIEEPNGERGTDPYYILRTYEVLITRPGQKVVATKCARYGQLLGRSFEDDPEECVTVEAYSSSTAHRVNCYELKDTTNVPGIVNGGVDERGWRDIYIKTEPAPEPTTCDTSLLLEAPEESVVDTRDLEVRYIPWTSRDAILVVQCGCYEDFLGTRTEEEECRVRTVNYTTEVPVGGDFVLDTSAAYPIECLDIQTFKDGRIIEEGCAETSYRVIPAVEGQTTED